MRIPERILLIEDNEDHRHLTERFIKKHWPDTELLVASNGEEAIAILDRWYEEPPGLILLDINMPRMSGHEFLDTWYRNHDFSTPNVVMLTSSALDIDRVRAKQFRCVRDYVVKPLCEESLGRLAGG